MDFAPTPDLIAKLKGAGASDEMIELISWHGKPLTKAPVKPPVPKTGEVEVTCAPAECEISIGEAAKGSTANGALRIPGLPPGSSSVDVKKKSGYVGSRATVTIEG